MNYQTYIKLNNKQKEEYNYRFVNGVRFNINGFLTSVMLLITLTILLVFTTYLVINTEIFSIYINNIQQIYLTAMRVIFVTYWIIIIYIVDYAIRLIIHQYKYSKWKKQNNIKEIYWYTKK